MMAVKGPHGVRRREADGSGAGRSGNDDLGGFDVLGQIPFDTEQPAR